MFRDEATFPHWWVRYLVRYYLCVCVCVSRCTHTVHSFMPSCIALKQNSDLNTIDVHMLLFVPEIVLSYESATFHFGSQCQNQTASGNIPCTWNHLNAWKSMKTQTEQCYLMTNIKYLMFFNRKIYDSYYNRNRN